MAPGTPKPIYKNRKTLFRERFCVARFHILTSHYTPEDCKDARTKIDYLKKLKAIAANCKNADEFKVEVNKAFPEYGGGNYLDMTANMFFA